MSPNEIRALRLDLGMTTSDFSHRLGIMPIMLQYYESGHIDPEQEVVEKLYELKTELKAQNELLDFMFDRPALGENR